MRARIAVLPLCVAARLVGWLLAAAPLLALAPPLRAAPDAARSAPAAVQVGSKRFTESYLLGAIVRETLAAAGVPAVHRPGLGNTAVLERSLASGAIDVYPEYSGTIVRELLRRDGRPAPAAVAAALAVRGFKSGVPLGFRNGYALAMREEVAARLGIASLSDLSRPAAHDLRLGLTHEFLGRSDGWPGLRRAYGLRLATPQGLDHGLAYRALVDGQVDVIDVYTTDARLARGGIRVLRDDRAFFPSYDAVLLMRAELDAEPLQRLAGRIDERRMIAMNAAVELDGRRYEDVAREFVAQLGGTPAAQPHAGSSRASSPREGRAEAAGSGPGAGVVSLGRPAGRTSADEVAATPAPMPARPGFLQRLLAEDLGRLTRQHLVLVFGSLLGAIALGVPLGVLAWRWPRLAQPVLAAVGVIQTVPSLALLAFLIALVGGIGIVPALIALFLYALLPIVRNTHAGLGEVGAGLAHAALALGMTRGQCLRLVLLPLAAPTVLAGVQTAATINVGTATLAAFIGAGGYGERIVAGLALNDSATLLAGAVPAALLALAVQGGFEALLRAFRRR
jgi:osmoprotectant transport system permease protein